MNTIRNLCLIHFIQIRQTNPSKTEIFVDFQASGDKTYNVPPGQSFDTEKQTKRVNSLAYTTYIQTESVKQQLLSNLMKRNGKF